MSGERGFVDESIVYLGNGAREYVLVCVIFMQDSIEDVRLTLRPFLLSGQRKLHWRDESIRRRKHILRSLSGLPMDVVVVRSEFQISERSERARRKCLEVLYRELSERGIVDLVLEGRDSSQNQRDVVHINALQQALRVPKAVRIRHIPGWDEPVLWIADFLCGLAGASRSEGDYPDEVLDKVVSSLRADL